MNNKSFMTEEEVVTGIIAPDGTLTGQIVSDGYLVGKIVSEGSLSGSVKSYGSMDGSISIPKNVINISTLPEVSDSTKGMLLSNDGTTVEWKENRHSMTCGFDDDGNVVIMLNDQLFTTE